jgi:hypothetical protein
VAGEALTRIAAGEDPAAGVPDLYAGVIGSWHIDATWYDGDGNVKRGKGEWHFERILGGLGVQDVLFAEGSAPHEYGTSLRTYDSGAGVWHVVWMQPSGGEFAALTAREVDGEIVQEGHPLSGTSGQLERWRFVDVTGDSFTWLGESSSDGGETWRLDQRMDARRMNK